MFIDIEFENNNSMNRFRATGHGRVIFSCVIGLQMKYLQCELDVVSVSPSPNALYSELYI